MINLLPDDKKRDISAARSNVILLRYNIFTLVSVLLLIAICLSFYIIMNSNKSSAVSQTSENNAKSELYRTTHQAAQDYQNNLATAKSIFASSVEYTPTILKIVELLPSGVVLENISLKATEFGKPTTFSAKAVNITQANALKANFQNSEIFENVHFQNISTSGDTTDPYPIQVVLGLTFKKVAS